MFTGAIIILGFITIGTLVAVANTFLELVFIHSVAAVGFAKNCFVASFTLCGLLFVALLLELLGVLPSSVGELVLGTCVTALVITVTVALPFVTLHAFARHTFGDGWFSRGVAALCIVGAWAGMRVLVSPCSSTDDVALGLISSEALSCTGFLDGVTSRAAFAGVLVVSMLGGYAILSTPVSYVEPLVRWRAVAAAERSVNVLWQRQLHVLRMWSARRTALAIAVAAQSNNNKAVASNGGIFGRLRTALADSPSSSAASLAVECSGYAQVSGGVFLAAQEAAERSTHTANIRSARGAIFGLYGVILAGYCVVKLLVTTVNLVLGRFSSVDPVTRALTLLGVFAGSDMQQQVAGSTSLETLALVFNTVMILSAIRGFLLLVFRLTCNNRAVTPEASLLVLSLSMSLYFLGTATLLRLSLPPDYRPQLMRALGALPFRYYHWYNDVGMLISAAVTAGILRWYTTAEDLDA